jgi:hypothetical protein
VTLAMSPRIDQMESSCRVIDVTLGQGFGDDHP